MTQTMITASETLMNQSLPKELSDDPDNHLYRFFLLFEKERPDLGEDYSQEFVVYYQDGTHYDDIPIFRVYERIADYDGIVSARFFKEIVGARDYMAWRRMWRKQEFNTVNRLGEHVDPDDPYDQGDRCIPIKFGHIIPSFPF